MTQNNSLLRTKKQYFKKYLQLFQIFPYQWNETVKDRPGEGCASTINKISKISKIKTWIISWKARYAIYTFIPRRFIDCQTRFHLQYVSLSYLIPFPFFVKERTNAWSRGEKERVDTQGSRPVIDELSRRVIRGERIGEDSRFTRASNPSLPFLPSPPFVRNYNQPWSVISGWIPARAEMWDVCLSEGITVIRGHEPTMCMIHVNVLV